MNILISVFGLAFLILIHEAGHFYASLAVGMRPRSFNIGFGPPLVKVRRRGIDYAVRAIPLGGYVKIPGMHRPAPGDVDIAFGRAMRASPELVGPAERLRRALATDDLSSARERLGELEQRAGELGVEDIGKPISDMQDALAPEAYWRQPTWSRIAAILAGPAANLAFAVVIFAAIFMFAAVTATTTVDKILPRRPAAAAGLRPGDRVVVIKVGSKHVFVNDPSQITETISQSRGDPVQLVVWRNNAPRPLRPVRPKLDNGVYRLGFQLKVKTESLGVGESFWRSFKLTGVVARETVKSLGRIVHKSGRDQISSPVGIVRESSRAAQHGWESYLGVLGFISLSLGLLNLLPLLPLDGGHIAFSLIEGVRGRALRREVYERVSAVGIALVLLLFIVGLSNDVGRLGGG